MDSSQDECCHFLLARVFRGIPGNDQKRSFPTQLGRDAEKSASFINKCLNFFRKNWVARLVGNEGMKPYMVMMGIHEPSFPTKGQPEN